MSTATQSIPAIVTCACCGEPFAPRGYRVRYCGQHECNLARGRRRMAAWIAKPGNRERMRQHQTAFRRRENGERS